MKTRKEFFYGTSKIIICNTEYLHFLEECFVKEPANSDYYTFNPLYVKDEKHMRNLTPVFLSYIVKNTRRK